MPDYKSLCRRLLRIAHGERIDNSAEQFYARDIELQVDVNSLLKASGAFDSIALDLVELGENMN